MDDDFALEVIDLARVAARRRGQDAHSADDCAQETFLKLYRRADWSRVNNKRAYAVQTAYRVILDNLRRSAAVSIVELPQAEVNARTEQTDRELDCVAALSALSRIDRRIAEGKCCGESSASIAARLGVSRQAVNKRWAKKIQPSLEVKLEAYRHAS